MSAIGDWSSWAAQITSSASAPLSSAGPLAAYPKLLSLNDFGKHLQAFGLFTPLGPIGPLGPLGIVGPLGPMGIHGFKPDSDGNYLSGSSIVRTVKYPYSPNVNMEWELVEYYTSATAANAVKAQDSSFMVESTIAVGFGFIQTPDIISFTSNFAQYVTIVLTPENLLDAFFIELRDSNGKLIASSTETFYINWIQITAAAGASYTVSVRLGASTRASPFGFTYRLHVTGSSRLVTTTSVTGGHIRNC